MTTWLSHLRLTLQQWAMLTLAGVVGLLALLVSYYQQQLQGTRVKLLSAHFEAEQEKHDNTVARAAEKVENSRRRYEDALSKYNNS